MKAELKTLIAPSLLSCDLARIADEANNMLDLGADWLVLNDLALPPTYVPPAEAGGSAP